MQTLGVSDSTPQSDNRLKNIFWPTIRSGSDVDTVGSQGYWICVIVAVFTLVTLVLAGQPIVGVVGLLFYYFGGVGVRQRSCYAAVVVFVAFVANFVASPGILNFFGCVLLLSVLRATFMASFWETKTAEAEMPVRFGETWGDKFADTLPLWLWPKIRIPYYIYSTCFLALMTAGLIIVATRHYRL
jgi:hypothetical protein